MVIGYRVHHILAPRILNVILGGWLLVSAFAWPHAQAQRTNTWVVGLISVLFALAAMTLPRARYFNTALAVWLVISTAAVLPFRTPGTTLNNTLVAIAIFVLSLVPSHETSGGSPSDEGGAPSIHPATKSSTRATAT
jgi:hypothetical protein